MSLKAPPRRRAVEAPPRKQPELRAVKVVFEVDPDPDASYLEQEDFSSRKKAYRRGDFHYVGVRAEAEVLIVETTQTLTSPGTWGIESDTEDSELERLVDEEWKLLRDVLKTVGVPTAELPLAVEREWIEWRM